MADGFNDPEKRRKVVKALLIAAPAMFAFGYLFTYWTSFRPTTNQLLIVGSASSGLTLGAAAVIAIFGGESPAAFRVIAVVVGAITALVTACSSRG
jgi:Sec-independent protein secretion pathway component TatC